MYRMPEVDLEKLFLEMTKEEWQITKRIVATRGKNKGLLRASKPPVDKENPITGKAAYVWRLVAFMASPMPAHSCMPVCADWDLPGSYGDERRALADEMDKLVDKIVATLPVSSGAMQWARGFGIIG